MTRKELAKAIAKKTKISSHQAENLIIAFGAVVGETLSRGDKIVWSNFGSFYTVHYPSKVIFHPKLGSLKKMIMLPTNVVKWMPSGNIKALVNNGTEYDNPTAHGIKKIPLPPPPVEDNSDIVQVKNQEIEKPAEDEETINEESTEQEIKIKINPSSTNLNMAEQKTEDKPPDSENRSKVFEETMTDGSKEISTIDGAIRIHKNPSFWNRIFKGKDDISPNSAVESKPDILTDLNQPHPKVTLAQSGVFDITSKNSTPNIPSTSKPDLTPPTASSMSEPIKNTASAAPAIKILSSSPISNPNQEVNKEPEKPQTDLSPNSKIENGFAENPNPTPPAFNQTNPHTQKKTITYIDLSSIQIPKELLIKIPFPIASKYKVVPVEENEKELVVAMIDPEDIEAKEIIKRQVNKDLSLRLTTESDINHVLDQYQNIESEVKDAVSDQTKEAGTEDLTGEEKDIRESASENAPAARIISSLLRRAIREKASDVHIEPAEDEVEIRFRVDGILKKELALPKKVQMAITSRIKILCNMKIDEQRLPQDGRFSITEEGRKVDFRVSTMPVAQGEKVVMRILDKEAGILTIDQLGVQGSGKATLENNSKKSHGMILVTGPTGSGKTTTLYALIDKLYTEGVNIVTLEDPIEYRMPGINQSQVNPEIDYTFAQGLRTIVRQDPDIIMIGEIRDPETAEMAVHAALTGHIVLSTLHTNNAAGAAPRLIDMGVEPFLLTSSINVIIAQRLARKICPDCKQKVSVPQNEIESIKEEIDKITGSEKADWQGKELQFFSGKGCKSCHDSGYRGRIGLYEVLGISEEVKNLILTKESSFKIQEEAVKQGMITMFQDGIVKALQGQTSIEEVLRVTKD